MDFFSILIGNFYWEGFLCAASLSFFLFMLPSQGIAMTGCGLDTDILMSFFMGMQAFLQNI